MKFTILYLLPVVSASPWFTNDGWAKPADWNSQACQQNPNVNYFCGTLPNSIGENQSPDAFPIKREGCTLADTLGRGCSWKGETGSC
ncbi:hypothetical protein FDECE_10468 [Fusarium decemcellulare]|nr:hypothetical protein FDECE_10468 [Fusarium decemcellulare]